MAGDTTSSIVNYHGVKVDPSIVSKYEKTEDGDYSITVNDGVSSEVKCVFGEDQKDALIELNDVGGPIVFSNFDGAGIYSVDSEENNGFLGLFKKEPDNVGIILKDSNASINTGDGDDYIRLDGDSQAAISSGGGDDRVSINDSSVASTILTGDGNDTVTVDGESKVHELDLGDGKNKLDVKSSDSYVGWISSGDSSVSLPKKEE